jgi:GAF domain-containing protein
MKILDEQVKILLEEKNLIASLANITAFLNQQFDDINWLGFYLANDEELILGPFQGKVACTHIKFDSGVCGKCASDRETQLIKNVHKFKGHIACDKNSNSELVLPLIYDEILYGVLDIDSPTINYFQKKHKEKMESIVPLIAERISKG